MVHEIRSSDPRAALATGADAGSSTSGSAASTRSGVQAGLSGRHGSQWSGSEFERRRAMLERMIEARADHATTYDDARMAERDADFAEHGRDEGFEHRFSGHVPVLAEPPSTGDARPPAEDAPQLPPTARPGYSAIERLVREFHLRDPLLAARSVSCRLDFGDALPVTAALSGDARNIEIRFDVTAETFALRTGCPVELMADALRARFGDLRIRIVFASRPVEDRREEDEA